MENSTNLKSFERYCRMCRTELTESVPKFICLKGHHQCEVCNRQWANKCGICSSFTKRASDSVVDLSSGNIFPHRRDSVSEYFKALKLQNETPIVHKHRFKRAVSASAILPGPTYANPRKPLAQCRGRASSTSSLSDGDNATLVNVYPHIPDNITDQTNKVFRREAPFLYNDFNDLPILVGLSTDSSSLSSHNVGSSVAPSTRHRSGRNPTESVVKKGASDADKHYEHFKKISNSTKTTQKMPPKTGIASFLTRSVRSLPPTAKESKSSKCSRDSKSSKVSKSSLTNSSSISTSNSVIKSSNTKVTTETRVRRTESLVRPRPNVTTATSEQLVSATQSRQSRSLFRGNEPSLLGARAQSSQPLGRAHKHELLFNSISPPIQFPKREKSKETSDAEQSHKMLASFKIKEHGIRTATATSTTTATATATVTAATTTTLYQDHMMSPPIENLNKSNILHSMLQNVTKEHIQDLIQEQVAQRQQMLNQHHVVQQQQTLFDCPLMRQDQSVDSQKSFHRVRSYSQDRQEFDQMFSLLQQQQQQQQEHLEKQKQLEQIIEQQKQMINSVQLTASPPHLAVPGNAFNFSATTTSVVNNGNGSGNSSNIPHENINELLGNQWESYTLYQRVPHSVNLKWPVDVELLQRFERAKQQNLVAIAKIDNDATRMHSTESNFSSPNQMCFGLYRDNNTTKTSDNNAQEKGHYCTTTTTTSSMQSMEDGGSPKTASSTAQTATTTTTTTTTTGKAALPQMLPPTNVKRDTSFVVMHATDIITSNDHNSAFTNELSQKAKADEQQFDARMEKVLGTLQESTPIPKTGKALLQSETQTCEESEVATDTAAVEETDPEDILLENIPSVIVSDAETDKFGRALLAIRAHYRPPSFVQISTVKLFDQPVCTPPAQQFQFVAEFEEDAESAEFYKKLQEEMKKEPVDAHEVIMDRAPLRCPDTKCDQSIFVSDFCQHLLCDHFSVPLERIEPSCCKTFFCDARFLRKGTSRCLMCFFIRGKIKNISNSEFKDYLPIMVMTSRVDMRELCGFPPRETRKSHEHMMFWVTGLVPEKLPISCSLAIWQTAGQIPGGHYCMSNDVYPLRCSQHPRDVWHSGCAMVLHPKEIYRLSRACTEMINLQLVIH